jgi:hypothetical protein
MSTDKGLETNASTSSRRAIIQALASAPVILTLVPGRARAEYDVNGVYFEGSCAVPPPNANSDLCTQQDPPGSSG